jgi:hypothetical protein
MVNYFLNPQAYEKVSEQPSFRNCNIAKTPKGFNVFVLCFCLILFINGYQIAVPLHSFFGWMTAEQIDHWP